MWKFSLLEIEYRLKHLSTYFVALIFMAIFFTYTNWLARPPESLDYFAYINSPISIFFTFRDMSFILTPILSYFIFCMFHRVKVNGFQEILFSQPLKRTSYIFGSFLGITIILLFFLIIGIIISSRLNPMIDRMLFMQDKFVWYLRPMLIITLPNIYILGSLFISVAVFAKKASSIFIFLFGIVILRIVLFFILHESVINYVFLDPFCSAIINLELSDLPWGEVNTKTIEFNSLMLYNRLFWISLSSIIAFIAMRYMRKHD